MFRTIEALVNFISQHRLYAVILSAAKNLHVPAEILRCAQNDSMDVIVMTAWM